MRAGDDGAGPVARTVAGEEGNKRGSGMIVGNRKEFGEILEKLGTLRRVLVLGCNECVTVCGVGGEREVGVLASELRLFWQKEGETFEIREHTLERQCDYEYIDSIRGFRGGLRRDSLDGLRGRSSVRGRGV